MNSLLRNQWDRVAAWAAAALGGLLLLIGYVKVSGTAFPAEQIPYLVSAGLGALFLLGIAGTLWIGADLRDEYAKLDEIARALQATADEQAAIPAAPASAAPGQEQESATRAAPPAQAGPRQRTSRPAPKATAGPGQVLPARLTHPCLTRPRRPGRGAWSSRSS